MVYAADEQLRFRFAYYVFLRLSAICMALVVPKVHAARGGNGGRSYEWVRNLQCNSAKEWM